MWDKFLTGCLALKCAFANKYQHQPAKTGMPVMKTAATLAIR
jgi:hypothetical protein